MNIERRIERLERARQSPEHGIRVIIMQSQGYPEATDEQIAEALKKYKEEHPDYREGQVVMLDFLHHPDGSDDQPDYEKYPPRPFRVVLKQTGEVV